MKTVYDYLDRSRAVEVFMNGIPAMSIATLREGQASAGADKRKGGKFLVLPPGYKDDVPKRLLYCAVKNQRRVAFLKKS